MWSHRLLYLLTLTLSALFYILYPLWFAWYLMIFLLLTAPFDLVISLPGMLTRRLTLSSPYVTDQNSEGALTVAVHSKTPLPSGHIKARTRITHEDKTVTRLIVVPGGRGSRAVLMFDTSRTGVTAFELRRVSVTSLMGLFTLPAGKLSRIHTRTLVMPLPVRPARVSSLSKTLSMRPKPGGGFSEDHEIRPYRRGDPVNSVHWKLSAKHDSLMIREPQEPPPHSRLVRITAWNNPRERDLILARLRWVSSWLLERGHSFCVKLGDHGVVAGIGSYDDLTKYLHGVLGGAAPSSFGMPARFTWVFVVDAREVA